MKHSIRAMTLSTESIDKFHEWCLGRALSMHTAKAYRSDLRIFLLESGLTMVPLEEVEEKAQTWLNVSRQLLAPATTGRRLTSIKVWAKWAGDPSCLADYRPPEAAKGGAHPILEGKDGLLRMIGATTKPNKKALVALTGLTGCRITEARDARPSWFNLHDMTVKVRGKGDKSRIVPISPDAWEAMTEAYVDALVVGPDARLVDLSDRTARRVITDLGRQAQLSRDISSHDMRHTYATLTFDKCRNIRVVQELLGHGSSSTTEIYTGVTQAALREAVQF